MESEDAREHSDEEADADGDDAVVDNDDEEEEDEKEFCRLRPFTRASFSMSRTLHGRPGSIRGGFC